MLELRDLTVSWEILAYLDFDGSSTSQKAGTGGKNWLKK